MSRFAVVSIFFTTFLHTHAYVQNQCLQTPAFVYMEVQYTHTHTRHRDPFSDVQTEHCDTATEKLTFIVIANRKVKI